MKLLLSRSFVCFLTLVVFLIPTHLFAWGREGHAIVAQIAESRLTPKAKAAAEELLAKGSTMSSVSAWADSIRKDREETSTWHYVNIPYEMKAYDAARDGKNGNNVIDKIVDFANVLNDRTRPATEREEALKFLIHFVGDLHQPLHSTDRNDDKGGNFRLVFFLDAPEALSLHKVWDSNILKHMMGSGEEKLSIKEYAEKIAASITEQQSKEWTRAEPVGWANESHQIAVNVVYAGVAADGPPVKLDEAYVQRAEPVVELQLARAGVRLAEVLNRIFR
ncbi:MAG: S1/P1 nuclease [Anaerolineae bacterium]|nr:S1/P1 nuclease [Phycisphaerae bacterium]